MDCGDAGHILLSRHVAEDLEQYPRWRVYLMTWRMRSEDGVRSALLTFTTASSVMRSYRKKLQAVRKHRTHVQWAAVAIGLCGARRLPLRFFFFAKEPAPFAQHCRGKKHRGASVWKSKRRKANAFFAEAFQDEICDPSGRICRT
jgi:hypothetical protein